MDNEQRFITMVGHGARVDPARARRAAVATLDTLFERLSGGEARDLAERLSIGLVRADGIIPDRYAEPFDRAEFRRRVADREGVDPRTAERHAVAVLTVLRIAAGAEEFDEMVAQLPRDFQPLVAEARRPHVEIRSVDDFVRRVAERTGLDASRAARATGAVLETLGERVTDREVADLTSRLGDQLAEPLRQGRRNSAGAARKLSAHKFLSVVAEREGAEPGQAPEHVHAVLTTLRESVPEDQFYEVVLQLPDDYAELLCR